MPKTPDSEIGVVGSTSLPKKRVRFTENLSIYLSSPAPNSQLQNPSNFGATASHWPLYILLFFFFLILTGWMRGALCVATRLYILYLAADESISGWEFLLLIPKSPHFLPSFLYFSLGAQFMRPCATSKQKSLVNYLLSFTTRPRSIPV